MSVPDIAVWLPNLRRTILVEPWRAVVYLRRLVGPRADRIQQPAHHADALGLLAEAYLRVGEDQQAVAAAAVARQATQALNPADTRRPIVVLGIAADIAVRTGHPQALHMASDYYAQLTTRDPNKLGLPLQLRLLLAAGLVAAAVYHTDCQAGRDQLDGLQASDAVGSAWTAGLTEITSAVAAVRQLCGGPHVSTRRSRPPPMPGGLLQPYPQRPPGDYLADRFTAHPPNHTHYPASHPGRDGQPRLGTSGSTAE